MSKTLCSDFKVVTPDVTSKHLNLANVISCLTKSIYYHGECVHISSNMTHATATPIYIYTYIYIYIHTYIHVWCTVVINQIKMPSLKENVFSIHNFSNFWKWLISLGLTKWSCGSDIVINNLIESLNFHSQWRPVLQCQGWAWCGKRLREM